MSFFFQEKKRLDAVIMLIIVSSFIVLKITKKNEPSWFTTAHFFLFFFDNLGPVWTSITFCGHFLNPQPFLSTAANLNGKTCATLKNFAHLLVLWNVIFNSGRNTLKRWISLKADFECWRCFCRISFTFRFIHHYNGCKFIRKLFLYVFFSIPFSTHQP